MAMGNESDARLTIESATEQIRQVSCPFVFKSVHESLSK